ncbi:MAG: hypothetical protein LQ347_002621 [Umbilicaria vellea]|nr:MAG: hypothetical protein LQ347_002621 [Umbilicaria vellea]
MISLSASSVPLSLSSSYSSDTDAETADPDRLHRNRQGTPAPRKGSAAAGDTGEGSAHKTEHPSIFKPDIIGRTYFPCGTADSDNDSDGYIADCSTRRSAKRKHPRSAGGKRRMLKLDRDDWKVIAGANGDNAGDGKARKRTKKHKAYPQQCTLSRQEMEGLLAFASEELDWEKAAEFLGGGGEDGAVGKAERESGTHGTGEGELQSAERDGDGRSAKSAAGLRQCWDSNIRTQLLKMCRK